MKRFVATATIWLLAGCGSSGGDPVFDDFTPAGGSALIFAPAVCDVPFVGETALAGVALDFTSYTDSCGVITETRLCGNKAGSTRILVLVVGGEPGADATEPLGPGTYRFYAEPPSDSFKLATAQAIQADDACEPVSDDANLAMTGGSVTITGVTATTVSGTTRIRFESGKIFEHTFDLSTCDATLDMCDRFLPCMNHVCVP